MGPTGHLRIERGVPEGEVDLSLREPEAREAIVEDLLRRGFRQVRATRFLVPVARQDPRDPVCQFLLEEPDILQGVVAPRLDGIALEVSPARRIDHVQERLRLAQAVQELVAQASALVGLGDETCYIEEFDGDEARAFLTGRVVRTADAVEIDVGALPPHVPDAPVRLDRREGIVRNLGRGHRRGDEEG